LPFRTKDFHDAAHTIINLFKGYYPCVQKKAVWLRPEAVAQIEFLEWTEADRPRHSKFVGLREDKDPRSVVKEQAGDY
jgi:ATP-dependent DNA ligase